MCFRLASQQILMAQKSSTCLAEQKSNCLHLTQSSWLIVLPIPRDINTKILPVAARSFMYQPEMVRLFQLGARSWSPPPKRESEILAMVAHSS